jgi:hypothetical protein
MTEENTTPTAETPAASPAEVSKETKAQGLLADVADRIKQSGPEVYNRLRDKMVDTEISERVALLDKGLQKRFTLMTDLRKVDKPDNEAFNADGSLAHGTYSKARLEEIKKAKEALQKHEGALEKALASNDFSKLKETCK